MDCQKIRPLLPGYLYKDADEREKDTVQAHLAECTDCQDEILSLRKTRDVLGCWSDEEVSTRLVFMKADQPWYNKIKFPAISLSWLRLRPIRSLSYGLAGALVLMALINSNFSYREGNLSLGFHLFPQARMGDNSDTYSLAPATEQRQLEMMNQMIQESEARQLREFDRRMIQFMWAVEGTRQQDMVQIGQAIDHMRLETGSRLAQTQKTMQDIILLTGSGNPASNR